MNYRVSYGNGQVSNTFKTYDAARRELLSQKSDQYAVRFRIQQWDGEEWIGLGKAGRPHLEAS